MNSVKWETVKENFLSGEEGYSYFCKVIDTEILLAHSQGNQWVGVVENKAILGGYCRITIEANNEIEAKKEMLECTKTLIETKILEFESTLKELQ